jgi:hypothetical protein
LGTLDVTVFFPNDCQEICALQFDRMEIFIDQLLQPLLTSCGHEQLKYFLGKQLLESNHFAFVATLRIPKPLWV